MVAVVDGDTSLATPRKQRKKADRLRQDLYTTRSGKYVGIKPLISGLSVNSEWSPSKSFICRNFCQQSNGKEIEKENRLVKHVAFLLLHGVCSIWRVLLFDEDCISNYLLSSKSTMLILCPHMSKSQEVVSNLYLALFCWHIGSPHAGGGVLGVGGGGHGILANLVSALLVEQVFSKHSPVGSWQRWLV
jgi:hypothetical protein